MDNEIAREERIDNYLLGRMSDAERAAFESDMANDEALKEEYENQRAIATAVQKAAMKDFLIKHYNARKDNRNTQNVLSVFFNSGKRVVWTLTSIAAMLVAVVGGVNYVSTRNTLMSNGKFAYEELSAPIPRDGNELDGLMGEAYRLIANEDFGQALSFINNAKNNLYDGLSRGFAHEAGEYEYNLLKRKLFDLEWYETIVLMRQGKVIKAKKALADIASSDSPYAEIAKDYIGKSF